MPCILVVDDDRAVQQMLVDLLEGEGYEVQTCRDGKQVLPHLHKNPCDLLILDVLIPHMNGFVLMEQLRSELEFPELPVIMISGIYRSRNHRTEMTTRFKVIDYLDKPLKTDRLLGLVQNVVGEGTANPKPHAAEVSDPGIAIAAELAEEPILILDAEPIELDTPKRSKSKAAAKASIEPLADEVSEAKENEKMFSAAAGAEKKEVEAAARQSFRTSAFLLQGSLKKTTLAQALGKLWHERATGGLLVRHGKVKKIIHIRGGNPYSVKSNKVSECLGQILMRERLITREECEKSIQLMKSEGKRQGEILVAMGCLTKNNLAFALELQIETKIFDMFTWDAGEFRFNSSLDLPPMKEEPPWTGSALVTEGIRRTFDETRLRAQMLAVLDVALQFRKAGLDFEEMGMTERERKALKVVELPRTTRELLDAMPLDPPDTLRVVFSLIALEVLAPVT